jgi:hypothetical protein
MTTNTSPATARTFDRFGNTDGLTHDATAVEITDRRTGSKTRFQGRLRQVEVDTFGCDANLGFRKILPDTRSTRDDVDCPACLARR